MWYPIQTLLGLYFARRIAGDAFLHEQPNPFKSTVKYALIFIISTALTNFFTPRIGQINPLGILTFAVMIGLSWHALKKQIQKSVHRQITMPVNRLYDVVTVFLIVYFVATAIVFSGNSQMYHAHPLTAGAIKYSIKVLMIVALIFYIYWGKTKKLIVSN